MSDSKSDTLFDTWCTRRDFARGIGVVGSSAALAALLPLSTGALADVALPWGQVPPVDRGRDEALGNYPGYAEPIGYGRVHLRAEAGSPLVDAQLLA